MLRYFVYTFAAIWFIHAFWPSVAHAQQQPRPVSQCQAIAEALPQATFASFTPAAATKGQTTAGEVTISYLGHSTFLIETPGGVSIATDYSGWYAPSMPPTVATMNKAHSSHYTLTPDPAIKTVLHGWSDSGQPARHDLVVGDAYIRNVTTDIRAGGAPWSTTGTRSSSLRWRISASAISAICTMNSMTATTARSAGWTCSWCLSMAA